MTLSLLLLWVVVLGSNHLTTLPLSVQGNGSPRHDYHGTQMDAPLQENPTIIRSSTTTTINCQTRPREKLSLRDQLKSSFKKWLRQRMKPWSTPEKKHKNRSDLAAHHHEYATVWTRPKIANGASAWIDIWQPSVEREEEISLARIRVAAGNDTIEIGWENDSYNHVNCLNTFCHDTFRRHKDDSFLGQSFNVPVMHRTGVRACFRLEKLSNGDWRAIMRFDEHRNSWWDLLCGTGEEDGSRHPMWRRGTNHEVGYWPAGVLPSLSHGATQIEWGGEVIYPGAYGSRDDYDGVLPPLRHTKTQMGSGRFAGEGKGKAAEFSELSFLDGKGRYRFPWSLKLTKHVTDANCYSVVKFHEGDFFFGGPGQGPNCLNPVAAA